MNVVEPFVRRALAQPERPAISFGPHLTGYGELLTKVRLLAGALAAAGVQPGDRVALAVSTPVGHIALTLALAHMGAVSIALSGALPQEEIEPIVARLGAHFLVHNRAEDFRLATAPLKAQISLDRLVGPLSGQSQQPPMAPVQPDDLWRIVMSSGTTGRPKGIALTHGRSRVMVPLYNSVVPALVTDKMLLGMAVSMGFALNYWLRTLYAGGCVAISTESRAEDMMRLLHEGGVTHLVTTTGAATRLAVLAQQPGSPYASPPPLLRLMNVGGSAVSPALYQALARHVCPALLVNYGSTEVGILAMLGPDTQRGHPDSAGRLVPWVQAEAVDEQGRPLPQGHEGLLRFRSPAMPVGYVGELAGPGELVPHESGWFQSQDRGRVTEAGLVYLGGRANEVMNLSGVKIEPQRLEQLICEDAAIQDCAVISLPGPMGQPALAAVVVAAGEFDAKALRERCAQAGPNCVPRLIVRVQQLPRNEAGKLMRAQVQAEVQAQLSAQKKPPTG